MEWQPIETAEDFAAYYFGNSGIADYRMEGDRVYWGGGYSYILPCHCGDEECVGWARVSPGGKYWHLFQNNLLPDDADWSAMDRADREAAQAIEARSAKTEGLGPKDESVVA